MCSFWFRPTNIVLCLISTVKKDYDQLDQMGVQVGLEGVFLVEGSDSRSVYKPQVRQLLEQAIHHPHHLQSALTTSYLTSTLHQHYVSHAFVHIKWSSQNAVTQPVCLQSSGDPFEMFNTFFGGGGMGGMGGGGGQQKFKMNMGGGGMGGGGMGGGGMGGGGIEELLMGGMDNCHATCRSVVSTPLAS